MSVLKIAGVLVLIALVTQMATLLWAVTVTPIFHVPVPTFWQMLGLRLLTFLVIVVPNPKVGR